jgi:Acetoacetate decarboxylase (ADC)
VTATSHEILGRTVTVPVEVRRARSWFASFAVPAARVAAILAPTGLRPATLPGGRAMLSLAFVRYDDGDLDAYREIAVAFLVADPEDPKRKGAYIHRLPVDQAFTCAAGRDIWGFPKFVTPIEITEGTSARSRVAREGRARQRPSENEELRADRAVLAVDGRMALTITQRRGIPAPMRSTALDAFSFGDGILRRTRWELRGSKSRLRPGGCRVELGTGALADELRSLGLPKRALMSGCIGQVAMTFQAAEIVTGARAGVAGS